MAKKDHNHSGISVRTKKDGEYIPVSQYLERKDEKDIRDVYTSEIHDRRLQVMKHNISRRRSVTKDGSGVKLAKPVHTIIQLGDITGKQKEDRSMQTAQRVTKSGGTARDILRYMFFGHWGEEMKERDILRAAVGKIDHLGIYAISTLIAKGVLTCSKSNGEHLLGIEPAIATKVSHFEMHKILSEELGPSDLCIKLRRAARLRPIGSGTPRRDYTTSSGRKLSLVKSEDTKAAAKKKSARTRRASASGKTSKGSAPKSKSVKRTYRREPVTVSSDAPSSKANVSIAGLIERIERIERSLSHRIDPKYCDAPKVKSLRGIRAEVKHDNTDITNKKIKRLINLVVLSEIAELLS